MKLSPVQKLKQKLIYLATAERYDDPGEIEYHFYDVDSDILSEFRSGEHETGLPTDWSRHYEAKAVAAQMLDGSWVGWTYWFGGGKHGNPREIPWLGEAYEVEARQVQKIVWEFSLPKENSSAQ